MQTILLPHGSREVVIEGPSADSSSAVILESPTSEKEE